VLLKREKERERERVPEKNKCLRLPWLNVRRSVFNCFSFFLFTPTSDSQSALESSPSMSGGTDWADIYRDRQKGKPDGGEGGERERERELEPKWDYIFFILCLSRPRHRQHPEKPFHSSDSDISDTRIQSRASRTHTHTHTLRLCFCKRWKVEVVPQRNTYPPGPQT